VLAVLGQLVRDLDHGEIIGRAVRAEDRLQGLIVADVQGVAHLAEMTGEMLPFCCFSAATEGWDWCR